MMIRVAFKLAEEAEAFAQEFGGVLLDTPGASDQAYNGVIREKNEVAAERF